MRRPARRPVLAVGLVCLLVLAGCSSITGTPASETKESPSAAGPSGTATGGGTPASTTTGATASPTQSPEPTATPEPSVTECTGAQGTPTGTPDPSSVAIPVDGNASLDFDVNQTYARTMFLLGNPENTPPDHVYAFRDETPFQPYVTDAFVRSLVDARETPVAGAPEGVEPIVLAVEPSEPAFKPEFVMAHESVHGPQLNLLDDTPAMEYAFSRDHHEQRLGGAILEGGASYVATEYMLRYTDVERERLLNVTDQYRTAGPAGKYHWAPYHFGQRYVEARSDSPVEHWCVYHDPPQTGEELIHALEPGSEPVADLSVSVDGGDWETVREERRGEIDVRGILAGELPEPEAAAGADGWGNDRLVELRRGGQSGFVWTLRWDDAANATEFREAFGAAMDARESTAAAGDERWTANGTVVRVVQVAPQTVVVVTGPETFTSVVELDGENDRVTATVDG